MGSRNDWLQTRLAGARSRLAAIKQQIAQAKYRAHPDWDRLWADRRQIERADANLIAPGARATTHKAGAARLAVPAPLNSSRLDHLTPASKNGGPKPSVSLRVLRVPMRPCGRSACRADAIGIAF